MTARQIYLLDTEKYIFYITYMFKTFRTLKRGPRTMSIILNHKIKRRSISQFNTI